MGIMEKKMETIRMGLYFMPSVHEEDLTPTSQL